jgi:hypothetical protein
MDNGFRWLTVGPKTQPDLEIVLIEPQPGPMLDEESAQAVRLLLRKGGARCGRVRSRRLPQDLRRVEEPRRAVRRRAAGTVLRNRGDHARRTGQLVQHDADKTALRSYAFVRFRPAWRYNSVVVWRTPFTSRDSQQRCHASEEHHSGFGTCVYSRAHPAARFS